MSKIQKSDIEQRQFWQMAVDTWRASGLSVRKFCKQEGLSEPSFYSWRRKLTGGNKTDNQTNRKRPHNQSGKNATASPSQDNNAPSNDEFIRVSLPPESSAAIEFVLVSGNKLQINSSADSKTLVNVLTALKQAGLC
jgi:hypothetical protein